MLQDNVAESIKLHAYELGVNFSFCPMNEIIAHDAEQNKSWLSILAELNMRFVKKI